MQEIFECIMLACFGLSWPISVFKSLKTRSTQGKSPVFMSAILTGYVCGIIGKLLGSQINYVLIVYCFNLAVVSFDFALYFINRRRERLRERTPVCERTTRRNGGLCYEN